MPLQHLLMAAGLGYQCANTFGDYEGFNRNDSKKSMSE